jgi:uncharacterized membrane protein
MGESQFASLPTAAYGVVMVFSAIAYTILQHGLIALQGPDSRLARAIGSDMKGRVCLAAYVLAIPAAFVRPWISCAIFAGVAMIWLIPDRRIEKVLT